SLEAALESKKQAYNPDKIKLYEIHLNVGNSYQNIDLIDEALLHYQLAYDAIKDIKTYKRAHMVTHNNVGDIHRIQKKYSEALSSFEKSIHFASNDQEYVIPASNIADILSNQGKYKEALEKAHSTLDIAQKSDITSIYSWLYYILAKTHNALNNPDSAIYYGLKGVESMKTSLYIEDILTNTLELMNAYDKKNNYKEALKYYKIHNAIKDSMSIMENQNKVLAIKFNNELNHKETTINTLEGQKQTQRWLLWSVVAILGLIGIVAL